MVQEQQEQHQPVTVLSSTQIMRLLFILLAQLELVFRVYEAKLRIVIAWVDSEVVPL
jgi:hypothetical protein